MAFCDLFKEFQPIRVDEEIYLRQHEPEQDARPFWEIYSDEEKFKYYGGYGKPSAWNEEREIRAETMGLKRIEAFAHVDNIGSNKTLQKAGFTKEGLMRKRFRFQNTLGDCNVYSFVREDLEKIVE